MLAYVAHFFEPRELVASRRATNLATHLPKLATQLPCVHVIYHASLSKFTASYHYPVEEEEMASRLQPPPPT